MDLLKVWIIQVKYRGNVNELVIEVYPNVLDDHNHEPTPEKLPCLQSVDEIKYRAEFTNDNPRTIINRCQTKIDEESSKFMVRAANLTQMVH